MKTRTSFGTVVFDEQVFPITNIEFREGQIMVQAYCPEAQPKRKDDLWDVVFIGSDGTEIGHLKNRCSHPELVAGSFWTFPIVINELSPS